MCLAIPGQIVSISPDELRTAKIAFGSVLKEASLALVPEAVEGDYVIVHAGVAISILDEQAAQEVFEELRKLGEFDQETEAQ